MIGVHETIWVGAILGCFVFLAVLLSPVRSLRRIEDAMPPHPSALPPPELGRPVQPPATAGRTWTVEPPGTAVATWPARRRRTR